ncbi:hypothetical protein [Caballeronia sp. dw_276]|uniref:hypothetical protein n=1 Tax=Caballeronia sp. dw_276 TaxID=2719795 RepID=UPI001BD23C1A|nr:hypothetical protein [Caballeronia sp. dw_276]
MWPDLPPSPSATSMPIQTPAYYEYTAPDASSAGAIVWLPTVTAFGTPGSLLKAKGMAFFVDGVPFLVTPQTFSPPQSTETASAEWTVPEQLDAIKSRLDISVTQLAELFSVTRKTVYDWYEGQSPRNAKKGDKIRVLAELLNNSGEADLKRLKAVWNIALPGGSFLSTLQSDTLVGSDLTDALAAKLNGLSVEMAAMANPVRRTGVFIGNSNLADIDRRSDAG